MGWVFVLLIAAGVFIALAWLLKLPRGSWELAGAALLLGIAGYALQGNPGQAGAPTQARETRESGQAALIAARQAMGEQFGAGGNALITADALARRGQFATAAGFLRGAVRQSPRNPDLWIALGNALVGHSGGMITPAALYAFQRAADISPAHPGPPFFTGLALAQSGQFVEARAIWRELLDRPGPDDEPWREDLRARLARLDQMIAMQGGPAAAPGGGDGGAAPAERGADDAPGTPLVGSGPVPVE